jgi:cytochrome c553
MSVVAAGAVLIAGCADSNHRTTQQTTTSNQVATTVPVNPPPPNIEDMKNPLGVTPETIASGKKLYDQACWGCHGKDGKSDGPDSNNLPQKPTNFTTDPDFQTMPDGEVFWIIKKGIKGTAMPSWETTYSDNQIWQIEAYIIQFRQDPKNRKGFGQPSATSLTDGATAPS